MSIVTDGVATAGSPASCADAPASTARAEAYITDAWTRAMIAGKARDLVRSPDFDREDRADIEQELTLHLWHRLRHFDDEKADYKLFARTVVDARGVMLRRHRSRQSRSAEDECGSLNEPIDIGEEQPVEAVAAVADNAHDRRLNRDSHRLAGLRKDVARALPDLSPDLRGIAGALMYMTPTDAMRHLGIARATFYSRLALLRVAMRVREVGE